MAKTDIPPRPRSLLARVVPEAPIVLAMLALLRWGPPTTLAAFAQFYPYAVLIVGLWLGVRYQRSRLVQALLVLAAGAWALHAFVTAPGGGTPTGRFVFQAVAFLLPLNLAAIALLADRGLLSQPGLYRLGALLAQVIVVGTIAHGSAAPVRDAFETALLPAGWFGWTRIGQPALLVLVGSAATLTTLSLFFANGGGTLRTHAWTLLPVFLALRTGQLGPAETIAFATAGLILVLAVIEASHIAAYQDGLTGLPGRRALTEALERLGGHYAVAMADVDHFKKFNDTYGHDVGDQVLRMVAARLADVGGGGRSFRYGGEEFAVVFAGIGADDALPVLDEVRRVVEETAFTVRGRLRPRKKPDQPKDKRGKSRKQLHVTISIGVAERGPRQDSPMQVIQAADRALYRAKDAGRNRVGT